MKHENDCDSDGESECRQIYKILALVSNWALRRPPQFLQLCGGHQAARESKRPENYFHGEDGHHERRNIRSAQIKFGSADESNAKRAEGVAERGSLRNGGHSDLAEGHADDRTEH